MIVFFSTLRCFESFSCSKNFWPLRQGPPQHSYRNSQKTPTPYASRVEGLSDTAQLQKMHLKIMGA